MATRIYDNFGRPQGSVDFRGRDPLPYEVDKAEDATYICFFDTALRAVHRVKDGKLEVAYGAWADRATLTYQPANQFFTVEE